MIANRSKGSSSKDVPKTQVLANLLPPPPPPVTTVRLLPNLDFKKKKKEKGAGSGGRGDGSFEGRKTALRTPRINGLPPWRVGRRLVLIHAEGCAHGLLS